MGVLKVRSGGVWVPVAQGVGIASPGLVGYAERTTDLSQSYATEMDVTGLSVSFTAIAGHTYRTSVTMTLTALTADQSMVPSIANAASAVLKRVGFKGIANVDQVVTYSLVESNISGAQTRKVRIYTGSPNQVKVAGTSGYTPQIVVEDITSAMEMGLAPSWTAPTLINGWLPFGSGWSVPGYRKVGDMVQLRGMVKSGTTGNIFTLPTGYASPNTMNFPAVSNDLFCQIRISGTGVTALNYNNAWVMLDGIQFSTTV